MQLVRPSEVHLPSYAAALDQITKTELAKRMHTSRAALNRLLDEDDPSLTPYYAGKCRRCARQEVEYRVGGLIAAYHQSRPSCVSLK